MKKTLFPFIAAFLAITMILTTGCEEDPIVPDPVDPIAPYISMTTGSSYADQAWEPGYYLEPISVAVDTGNSLLNTVTVYMDGVKISIADEILTTGNGPDSYVPSNAALLSGLDAEGNITLDYGIHLSSVDDTVTYMWVVTDTEGLSDSVSLTLVTLTPEPDIEEISGTFYNNAGNGAGRIDLETGVAYKVADETGLSDIEDTGNVGGDWAKVVQPLNGATFRTPIGISYSAFVNYTEMSDAWDNGVDAAEYDVTINDNFLVKDPEGRIYAVRFDVVTDNAGDDDDTYDILIKKLKP